MSPEAKQILVIDDDAARRQLSVRILSDEGFAITAVAEGFSAIRAAGCRRFALTIAPLTARFFCLRGVELRNPRDVELRLTRAGEGSDHGWSLQVRTDQLLHSPPRRLTPSGTSLPGLGRNYGDLWIGVFNPEPAAPAVYELTVTITVQSPPGIRRAFSPLGRGPR